MNGTILARGTTPTFIHTLPRDVDLTEAAHVYATYKHGKTVITKTGDDISVEAHSVSVYLSQAETLKFPQSNDVESQINWTYADGSRGCTEIVKIAVRPNLIPEVLP